MKHNPKATALAIGVLGALFFVICILWYYVLPAELQQLHVDLLRVSLPGFTWLTVGTFILGLVESFVYGFVAGYLFAVLYNTFLKS